MNKTIGNVIVQQELVPSIYSLLIETEIALTAKAGQFVSIYCKDERRLLPRPISISSIDKNNMTIRLVYRVAGKGTAEFTNLRSDDKIEILGPLGNGFPIDEVGPWDKVILMGGGIGIPPMVGCLDALKEKGIRTYSVMGYRDSNTFLTEELSKSNGLYIATEDGSKGTKGNVLDAVSDNNVEGDIIFACGPTPMLSAIKTYALKNSIKCYISMEERMACSIGACLGCVVKTTDIDDHSKVRNKRVCKDGPVFRAEEVELGH